MLEQLNTVRLQARSQAALPEQGVQQLRSTLDPSAPLLSTANELNAQCEHWGRQAKYMRRNHPDATGGEIVGLGGGVPVVSLVGPRC